MEMCYDGTLVMPSSYAVMSEEEMTYVEGGKFSLDAAKALAFVALGFVLEKFVGGLTTELLKPVVAACAGWIKGLFETAYLTILCYPEKVAAIAAGITILAVAGYAVYRVGKRKGAW